MSGERFVNLHELHREESTLARYRRLVAGEFASVGQWALQEFLFFFLAGLKGLPGYGLRRLLYPRAFRGFHVTSTVGSNVTLRCPQQISLGEGCVLDDFCQLIATTGNPEGISMGKHSFVRSFASLNAGPPDGFIRIGSNTGIGQHTVLYGNGGLAIGDNVMVSGHCFIVASSHRTDIPETPFVLQGISARGIVIEDNVWIGAGARILDGVRIGTNSVVAANAVVTRSIPPNSRVGGVPARPLRPAR